jgi:hypothetical protein
MLIPIVLLMAAATGGSPPDPDCSAVPGFTQKGPLRTYSTDTLFEYMNGNSEGYFAYGFRQMRGVTCTNGKLDLVFDISEMESPELAWGMFTGNRDSKLPLAAFAAASQVTPRRGTFAKGSFYVELAANPTAAPEVIEAFLKQWEQRIGGTSSRPALLDAFPTTGMQPESLRLVPESVLGFRMLRRGFVAQYTDGKAFVIPTDSSQAAAALLAQFRQRVNGNQAASPVGEEAFQVTDKYLGRLYVFRKGRFLAGASHFPTAVDPAPLAGQIAAKLP